MPEVVVLGAGGMLGHALREVLEAEGVEALYLTRDDLDIRNVEQVPEVLDEHEPEWVVNAAAYTDVDGAEADEGTAMAVNGEAVGDLATSAMLAGAKLIHVSTDYVFDGTGTRPYTEDDPRAPLGAYGRTKARGEDQLLRATPDHVIVRTAWLYGPGGKNFARTILEKAADLGELKVVDDQRGTPTYTPDLARAILGMIRAGAEGIYHVTNAGETTWCGFARRLVETAGIDAKVNPCTTAEFPRPAPRPAYSVLDTSRVSALLGAPLRPWEEAADEYVTRLRDEGAL